MQACSMICVGICMYYALTRSCYLCIKWINIHLYYSSSCPCEGVFEISLQMLSEMWNQNVSNHNISLSFHDRSFSKRCLCVIYSLSGNYLLNSQVDNENVISRYIYVSILTDGKTIYLTLYVLMTSFMAFHKTMFISSRILYCEIN